MQSALCATTFLSVPQVNDRTIEAMEQAVIKTATINARVLRLRDTGISPFAKVFRCSLLGIR